LLELSLAAGVTMISPAHSHRPTLLIALFCLAVLLTGQAAGIDPAPEKADAELKQLRDRVGDASANPDKLRQDLQAFARTYPGTPQAVQAAGLVSKLSSPLDKMDAKNIPELERFDWQPKELVAVIGEHRGRHGNPVSCVACSPDGKVFLSGGGSLVRFWDPATMRLQATLGVPGGITCMAYRPDGKMLAVGCNYEVHLYDLAEGKPPALKFTIKVSTVNVYGIAFRPDGNWLATAGGENEVKLFDVSGEKVKEVAVLGGHTKAVYSVAFSATGKWLASGSADETVRLWDLSGEEPKEKTVLKGHKGEVNSVTFAPAEKGQESATLATAGTDGAIHLWGIPAEAKAKERSILPALKDAGSIYRVVYSHNGKTIAASYGIDLSVRLWTVGQPSKRHELKGHDAYVSGIAFAPDDNMLLTGSPDWTARTWDLKGNKPDERFVPWSHLSLVRSVAFSPDMQTLASVSEDRVLRLWDVSKLDPKRNVYVTRPGFYKKDDNVPLTAVAYSPDGKSLAISGNHAKVRQYNAANGEKLRLLEVPSANGHGLTYSPDGHQILLACNKEVHLFDAVKGGQVRSFTGHESPVTSAALSPDGLYVLTGSGTNKLDEKGRPVLDKNNQPVYIDCALRLFDAASGKELWSDKTPTVPLQNVAFAPDGTAFTCVNEPQLRKWEVVKDKLNESPGIRATAGYAQVMRFSPDGRLLATTGLDGKLILWKLADGTRVRDWVFQEGVANLAFAADNRHLAVSLWTGVVYVLRLPGPEEKGEK
jgi:WD40 repeat protein